MADFSNIENQIDNAITTNGVGAITGAILNAILKGMLSAVDAAKEDTLTFDLTPTEDSTKPVTSGGVYDALEAAAQAVATTLTNYYTKTQADSLLSAKADDADVVHLTGNETIAGAKTFSDTICIGNGIDMNGTKVEDLGTPTADTDAATKKYVDDGLATKQDTLTIDATPTDGSDNPVASNGVYDGLAAKQDTIGDLATIRSGAAAGATAVQPATMQTEIGNVAFQTGEKVNATKVVNDLTTGGATDVLSAEQGKELITKLGGSPITLISGRNYYCGTIGNAITYNSSTTYEARKVSCSEGDIFIINALGGSNPRPYAFVDADNKVLANGEVNAHLVNEIVVAPTNTAAIVINNKLTNPNNVSYYVPNGSAVARIMNLESTIEGISRYKGLANTATVPDAEEGNFYLTDYSGTYTNFDNLVVGIGELCALVYTNNAWRKDFIASVKPKFYAANDSYAPYEENLLEAYFVGEPSLDYTYSVKALTNRVVISITDYSTSPATNVAAQIQLSDMNDGEVAPAIVYSAGLGYEEGDILGYVLIKDVSAFVANVIPDSVSVKKQLVTNKAYSPTIQQYLALQEIQQNTFPDTFLPNKIYGVIGDTQQIFVRGIVQSWKPYNWYNQFLCGQGKVYQRYLEITPALIGGSVPTDLTIKHKLINDSYMSSEQTTSQYVLAARPTTSPANNINVLCVGASTTRNGEWASELKRRLTDTLNSGTPNADGLTNITFVGRKELSASGDTRPMGIKFEATGGWTWSTFFTPQPSVRIEVSNVNTIVIGSVYVYQNADSETVRVVVAETNITGSSGNIRCVYSSETVGTGVPVGTITKISGSGDDTITYSSAEEETYCPFYDESTQQPDFAHYASLYCNNQIDVVIFNLGNNNPGVVGTTDPAATINNMKTLLDALHADFPSCKVIIGAGMGYNTHYGLEYNNGASSSVTSWADWYGLFNYNKAVEEFIKGDDYKGWCFMANLVAEIDSENVFPTSTKAVNTRMPETEVIGTNGAHPELAGYKMAADCFYRCFVNVVLN